MKKLIYYIELILIFLALCFVHFPVVRFEYAIVFIVVVYKLISTYKSRSFKKINEANCNIIADLQTRLKYELQHNAHTMRPLTTDIELTTEVVDSFNKTFPEGRNIAHVPEITDNELVQLHARAISNKDIAQVAQVHPSTISRRIKKLNP